MTGGAQAGFDHGAGGAFPVGSGHVYDAKGPLRLVQSFEPTGVGARNLAECLAIQLRERDRFDPAMAALVENLDLVARRDMAGLMRICKVDADDLADMLKELRHLNPKPGNAYGSTHVQAVIPSVAERWRGRAWTIGCGLGAAADGRSRTPRPAWPSTAATVTVQCC